MTRSELIVRLAHAYPRLRYRKVARAVDVIFTEITEALTRGDRVELRGFGTFAVKQRKARIGRNPRDGAKVDVPPKRAPFFRSGKRLIGEVNSDRKVESSSDPKPEVVATSS